MASAPLVPKDADKKADVVSRGDRFEVKNVLKFEGATVLLFVNDTSVMEQQFLADLEKQLPVDDKMVLDVVRLKDTSVPAAQQYQITATPINTVGTPSPMNTHCQPLIPSMPSISRMAAEAIDATALATGCAMNSVEITRPRYSLGNQ